LKIKKISAGREGEISSQYVSSRKVQKMLGWKPKIDINEGLKKTVSWYFEYLCDKNSPK
jgi:CDP-glucose 4,6-dehydratase